MALPPAPTIHSELTPLVPFDRSTADERRSRVAPILVTLLAAASLPPAIRVLLRIAARLAHGGSAEPFGLMFVFLEDGSTIAAAVLAVILVWRRSAPSGARALATALALIATMLAHDALYAWVEPRVSALTLATLDVSAPMAMLLLTAALVRFSTSFPQPLTSETLPPGVAFRRVHLAALRADVVWGIAAAACVSALVGELTQGTHAIAILRPVLLVLVVGALALTASNVRLSYRAATGAARRRLFWVMEGFVAMGSVIVVATMIKGATMLAGAQTKAPWYGLAFVVAGALLLGCLTIAMFFSGAFDPSLALERTAVFALVGVILVFVFAAVENVVHEYLREWLGLSDSTSGIIIGGVVALTADPIKERTTHIVARLLARWGMAPAADHSHSLSH